MSVGGTVLLVSSRPEAHALRVSLSLMGADVRFAEAGLPALTQLERVVPDTIVCDSTLDDMSGRELMEIVRDDPQLHAAVFALLGAFDGNGFGLRDLAVPPGLPLARVLREVLPILAQPAAGRPADRVMGDLYALEVADVLDALELGQRTGILTFDALSCQSQLWVSRGRLVHTQYGVLRAEEALRDLLDGLWRTPDLPFSFEPLADLPPVAHPIRERARALLRPTA